MAAAEPVNQADQGLAHAAGSGGVEGGDGGCHNAHGAGGLSRRDGPPDGSAVCIHYIHARAYVSHTCTGEEGGGEWGHQDLFMQEPTSR